MLGMGATEEGAEDCTFARPTSEEEAFLRSLVEFQVLASGGKATAS